jgi:hypothetical protein
MSSETTQEHGPAADEIAVGDTVRFRDGRRGTFETDTELVVKELIGAWFTADQGRTEVFLLTERVETVAPTDQTGDS